jgi:hypothetical protein
MLLRVVIFSLADYESKSVQLIAVKRGLPSHPGLCVTTGREQGHCIVPG